MKGYKYEIGDIVQVNEFAANGMPTYLGKYGKIKDFITHGSFDYEVEFDKFSVGKFKELELDKEINEENLRVKETVKLTNTLIDTFLSQYKNSDDTYTLPKIVLEKLVDSAFEEAE